MPTINFDWGRFNDSQWFGHPKNGNWSKYPQWEADVVSSNHDAWTPELADVKQAHRFTGYKSDVYFDADGDCGDDVWMDHLEDEVDLFFMEAPLIQEDTVDSGTEGEAYSFQFVAAGATPITWAVSENTDDDLPTGLTLDEETGELSGTPTQPGDFDILITATNAKGSDDYEFTLTIEAAE